VSECRTCEGSGRIAFGAFGTHYRDGEKYDAPGEQDCEACNGTGQPINYRNDPREREQWQFERYCEAHPDYLDNAL
jgi:DnaJ-class molecular chaperone